MRFPQNRASYGRILTRAAQLLTPPPGSKLLDHMRNLEELRRHLLTTLVQSQNAWNRLGTRDAGWEAPRRGR